MARPDLNLLVTLDVLLSEGSVTRAARRLRLSPSAMSRSLARLRDATGDPLLVRAGRTLVPTRRAIALQAEVRRLVQEAEAVLRPDTLLDVAALERTFVLRASDGFAESFGPALIAGIRQEAPGVRLRLVRKLDKDSAPLREGAIDFETGVIGRDTSPELRTQALFRDRFVVVVRDGHPLRQAAPSAAALAAQAHVAVVRDGDGGASEAPLKAMGLRRNVVAEVDGYSAACALIRQSDLVGIMPERHTAGLRAGLAHVRPPFDAPDLLISLLWHPRQDGDPAHRWMRGQLQRVCAATHELFG